MLLIYCCILLCNFCCYCFSHLIYLFIFFFFSQNLYDAEKRKMSYPTSEVLRNGDASSRLMSPDNHTIVDMKEETVSTSTEDIRKSHNDAILKRIPPGAQCSSILVGEVDFLEQPAVAFIRLAEGVVIPSLIEVNIPVRFIFLLLGPKKASIDYHEVGRSISTLMANQQFHNIAYGATNRKALLSAINEFLDDSIVLPPGDWERQALLPIEEIKAKSELIRRRKENALKAAASTRTEVVKILPGGDGDDEKKPPFVNPLERTKRPWGGLINDVRRRYPFYKSDILDALNAQCLAAAIFMYFAAVSGAVAFGGLIGDKTDDFIGISENLAGTSIAGIIFAIFSGQPLVIVGTTGPLLLFDESLFQFCTSNGLEYVTTRFFVGLWLAVIAIVVACFEGSVCIKLFSRFTEDIFSALIVFLYILESVMKLFFLFERHPLLSNYCGFSAFLTTNTSYPQYFDVNSELVNGTEIDTNTTEMFISVSSIEKLQTKDALGTINQPNTALFCTVLALGTFAIAYYLRMFRNMRFLGRSVSILLAKKNSLKLLGIF